MRRAVASLLAVAALAGHPASGEPQATDWVGIQIAGGSLLVASEVGGIPGWSVIDTGAQANGINASFVAAHELSLPRARDARVRGVHQETLRTRYRDVPAKLFGAPIEFESVTELDLGSPKIQLLLGAPLLESFIFQLDYPNGRMRLLSRDTVDLAKLKNVESKNDPLGGSPLVRVRLNDEEDVWLTMDTGNAGGVLISRSIASQHGWLERYPRMTASSRGVNAEGLVEVFNLPMLRFGPFEIESPIVRVPAEGESLALFEKGPEHGSRRLRRVRKKSQGLLGYDVLQHFVVTVDYRRGHVHVALPE